MLNSEFITLLTANTNKTMHIRAYSKAWVSGTSQLPDELLTKIGKIIGLLQTVIDQGQLCDQDECLLIYNFEPLAISPNNLYCSIDMLIKPMSDINNTSNNIGRPIQVVVDGNSGEICNNTQALLDLNLLTEQEVLDENLDPPQVLGYYHQFKAPCCFAALPSYKPIKEQDMQDIFEGKYDKSLSIQQSIAFDSLIEADRYLSQQHDLGRCILEIIGCKEDYSVYKQEGLSQRIYKIINFFDNIAVTNPQIGNNPNNNNAQNELMRPNYLFSELNL